MEVVGSNPVGDSDFSLFQPRDEWPFLFNQSLLVEIKQRLSTENNRLHGATVGEHQLSVSLYATKVFILLYVFDNIIVQPISWYIFKTVARNFTEKIDTNQ